MNSGHGVVLGCILYRFNTKIRIFRSLTYLLSLRSLSLNLFENILFFIIETIGLGCKQSC